MRIKDSEYETKKSSEITWYEQKGNRKRGLASAILHHPLFFAPERNSFNYIFPKKRMREVVQCHLKDQKVGKLLIAPCGKGDDLKYLGDLAKQVYGIALSPLAVKQCSPVIEVKVADILHSGYPDETFELIASALFFHHLLRVGFEPFLKEFHRLLKPSGKLVILEPCVWYPLNLITRPMKRILRNPFGEVPDEDPFDPRLMGKSLKRAGFVNLEMQAASFSHCSFYVPIAKLVNRLTKPLLTTKPFKYLGWMVVYWAEKW